MQVARWTSLLAVSSFLVLGGWSAGSAHADGMRSSAGQSGPTERGVWFGGYDTVKGSNYYFDGIVVALNGNMSRDGLALRVYGSRVDYDLSPGDGRGYQADFMLGYHFTRGGDVRRHLRRCRLPVLQLRPPIRRRIACESRSALRAGNLERAVISPSISQ